MFEISREKWLRGEGGDVSRLLREGDGKMCCIGQVSEQCGIPLDDLKNVIELNSIGTEETRASTEEMMELGDILGLHRDLAAHVYATNDDDGPITDERRIDIINMALAKAGVGWRMKLVP